MSLMQSLYQSSKAVWALLMGYELWTLPLIRRSSFTLLYTLYTLARELAAALSDRDYSRFTFPSASSYHQLTSKLHTAASLTFWHFTENAVTPPLASFSFYRELYFRRFAIYLVIRATSIPWLYKLLHFYHHPPSRKISSYVVYGSSVVDRIRPF